MLRAELRQLSIILALLTNCRLNTPPHTHIVQSHVRPSPALTVASRERRVRPTSNSPYATIACSSSACCALRLDAVAHCGEVGAHNEEETTIFQHDGVELRDIRRVVATTDAVCVLSSTGTIQCRNKDSTGFAAFRSSPSLWRRVGHWYELVTDDIVTADAVFEDICVARANGEIQCLGRPTSWAVSFFSSNPAFRLLSEPLTELHVASEWVCAVTDRAVGCLYEQEVARASTTLPRTASYVTAHPFRQFVPTIEVNTWEDWCVIDSQYRLQCHPSRSSAGTATMEEVANLRETLSHGTISTFRARPNTVCFVSDGSTRTCVGNPLGGWEPEDSGTSTGEPRDLHPAPQILSLASLPTSRVSCWVDGTDIVRCRSWR